LLICVGSRLRNSPMPVVVVVDTTILALGTRGSRARMSWVQMFTSPTLTACIQSTSRLVIACLSLVSYRPNRSANPFCQLPRRRIRTK